MRIARSLSVSMLALVACAGSTMAQQVKISQIYGGGGNASAPFNRDFVELFNAGGAAVDLSGWSVQYAAATGTTWSKTDLTGLTLQPGQYYLIQMTLTGTNGSLLPTPDHIVSTAIAMSATAGKVALVNNTTALSGACPTGPQIIDFVGFGTTANCNEGGLNTGAPSNTTAVLRNDNGCADVGNNAADFTVDVPNPRNSGSALSPCPLPPGSDLAASISDGETQVSVGATVAYQIIISNFGPDATSDATVTVPIPSNATYIASSVGTPIGGVLTFNTGPIAAGANQVYSLTLQADSGIALNPVVSVSGPSADADLANNMANDSDVVFDRARVRAVIGGAAATAPFSAIDVGSGGTETYFQGEIRALAADDADRVFYYSSGTQLWRVSYDDIVNPVMVAAFNGAVTTISGGMAFDPIRRKLIASTTSSFYEVNRQTGRTTLLRAVGAGDFSGIDYDAVNDRVCATNDSTSTTNGLQGRGLYRVDVYSSEVPVLVTGYPFVSDTAQDTDIDGLAYGGGRWYPVADQTTWFYTFDEGSGSFLENLPTNFVTDRTNSGAAYTEQLYNRPPGANLTTTVSSGTADCSVSVNGMVTYTVQVTNLGPSTADNVVISSSLPAGTVFVSSNPPVVPVGQDATLNLGSLGDGQTATLEITAMVNLGGSLVFSGSGSSTTADAYASNNAGSTTIRVQETPPATADAKGVFSTLPGSNAVPGLPGVSFSDVVDMGRAYRSASGNYWIMQADTDVSDATMDRVLLRGTSTGFEVVAQEGVSQLPVGFPTGNFDVVTGINNAGNFCFSTDYLTSDTNVGKIVVKNVGNTFQFVAEQGGNAGTIFGGALGSAMGSACIQADDSVSFYGTVTGVATANNAGLFSNDNTNVVAQKGVTIPSGQIGGEFWENFLFSTDRGFYSSADGQHYCAGGDLTGATTSDAIVVVDGNVVIQEGSILPNSSYASPVSAIGMNYMNPDGAWFAYGSNADGGDWAVRNGQVVASRDDEIFPGAGIHWAEAGFTGTFFMNIGDGQGNYVVGGLTDAGDTNANAMLVLNGERIVLRENDPIDLDNNGVFDDDAYIHIFRDDFAFLTDGGDLYVPVRVRSGAGICSGTPAETGQALVRIAINLAAPCPQDFNMDGNVDPDDLGDFINCYFSIPSCDRADFNMDGNVDPDDLGDFINVYFGPPCN